jgi:hypothetical protein
MKMFSVVRALIFWLIFGVIVGGTVFAQEAQNAFVVHPYRSDGDPAGSRFWTPSTIALVALDGGAKAADSYITRRNIDGGGAEFNPIARPFVHTAAVQAVATGAMFGAEVATAYWLHRRGHDNFGRAVLVGGAVVNGVGAALSFKHRVAEW